MNEDGRAECPYTDCGDCPFAEGGREDEEDEDERVC